MVEDTNRNEIEQRGVRCNSMWSLWYGAVGGITLAYLVARSARRYLGYMSLSWPPEPPPREWELHLAIAGTALAAVLIPPFLAAAFFKVGNFANDGYKLGWDSESQSCEQSSSCIAILWKHAGPTAPALHVLASLCLLLPKLLLEARLLEAGFLPKDSMCKTDLSYLAPQYLANSGRQILNSTKRVTTEASLFNVNIFEALDPNIWSSPFSAEFLQYGTAMFAFGSRHSAVFWQCGIRFSIGFAVQQACAALQSFMLLSVCALLYKHASLPIFTATLDSTQALQLSTSGVMLDRGSVLLLTIASLMFLMLSGSALYAHGLNRLDDVVRKKRECSAVTYRKSEARTRSSCSGCGLVWYMVIMLSLGLCITPLLSSVLYVYCPMTPSLPSALSVLSTALLLMWFPLWLWLRNSPLHFGLTDALLQAYRNYGPGDAVLVLGGKRAYTVTGAGPKASIMAIVKDSTQRGVRDSTDDLLAGQVYWLRESNEPPRRERDRKISFGDEVREEDGKSAPVLFEEVDDGDYATLMKLPVPPPELMDPEERHDVSESTLRRTDSGMPHDEITPCSDSEDNTEAPPPDTSEGSSSGVTSAASSVCKPAVIATAACATTCESTFLELPQPPLLQSITVSTSESTFVVCPDAASSGAASPVPPIVEPATVVIRRKPPATRVASAARVPPTEEPFGRSTNMRMTSFAEGRVRTLPYMPSQKPVVSMQQQQHCSTMPAQPHTSHFMHSRASLQQHPTHVTRIPTTHQITRQTVVPQLSQQTVVPQGHRSFSQRLLQYECRNEQQPIHQVYRTPGSSRPVQHTSCITEHV